MTQIQKFLYENPQVTRGDLVNAVLEERERVKILTDVLNQLQEQLARIRACSK